MRQNMRLTNRAGYSFVEMLTVIAMMAILMSITVMSMAPRVKHGKVNNAANVVVGDLQYAQSLAVRHRRPIAVIVQPSTRLYVIRDRDNPPGEVYRTRVLGQESEFSLDSLGASPTSVEFYPNGVARTTTTLTMGLDGYHREVKLTRAGQIRIVRN